MYVPSYQHWGWSTQPCLYNQNKKAWTLFGISPMHLISTEGKCSAAALPSKQESLAPFLDLPQLHLKDWGKPDLFFSPPLSVPHTFPQWPHQKKAHWHGPLCTMSMPTRTQSFPGSWWQKMKIISINWKVCPCPRIEIVASYPYHFNPCWLAHSHRTDADLQSLRLAAHSIPQIIGPFRRIATTFLQGFSVDLKLEVPPDLLALYASLSFLAYID